MKSITYTENTDVVEMDQEYLIALVTTFAAMHINVPEMLDDRDFETEMHIGTQAGKPGRYEVREAHVRMPSSDAGCGPSTGIRAQLARNPKLVDLVPVQMHQLYRLVHILVGVARALAAHVEAYEEGTTDEHGQHAEHQLRQLHGLDDAITPGRARDLDAICDSLLGLEDTL